MFIIFTLLFSGNLFAGEKNNSSNGTLKIPDKKIFKAADGKEYTYIKTINNGRKETYYLDGDKKITREQMVQKFKNVKKEVIQEDLQKKIDSADSPAPVKVIILLKNQPGNRIADTIRQKHEKKMNEKSEKLKKIHTKARPSGSLTEEQEKMFKRALPSIDSLYTEADKEEIRRLQDELDAAGDEMNAEIDREVKKVTDTDKKNVIQAVESLGGQVTAKIYTINALSATIALDVIKELAQNKQIAQIWEQPEAISEMNISAQALKASYLWNNGIDGGAWDAGVIDTGLQHDHPAFNGVNLYSKNGSTVDYDGHGTAVAGIIASQDSTYKGIAYGMDKLSHGPSDDSIATGDWMVSRSSSNHGGDDMDVINLSFGHTFGNDEDYSVQEQFWDSLVFSKGATVVKSAGNSGAGEKSLTNPARAYNVITVGNINDYDTTARSNDKIAYDSSRGPTPNGRKKPDLVAPGSYLNVANNDWATGDDFYNNSGGTSFAAPHVTGAALLLMHHRGNDYPRVIKAGLINTADAWSDNGTLSFNGDDGPVNGSHWNATYGWGYIDLSEVWYNGKDTHYGYVNENDKEVILYEGYMFANEKATLVWDKRNYYNGTFPTEMYDLSDLDLFLYSEIDGYKLDSSVSGVDNVEQVATINNKSVVLKIYVWDLANGLTSDRYGLATEENFKLAAEPTFSFTISSVNIPVGQAKTVTITVKNNGSVNAFNNDLTITLPEGLTNTGGGNTVNIGTIADGTTSSASFSIRRDSGSNTAITVSNRSRSYGESFTSTGTVYVGN